jgi:hypothetical protein
MAFRFGPQHALINRVGRPPPMRSTCGKYLGDNDGTCPQLTCIRRYGHEGLCDNVHGDPSQEVSDEQDRFNDRR